MQNYHPIFARELYLLFICRRNRFRHEKHHAMPRKKNDGRGRLGGREKGTPNRDNPLKVLLHEHSEDYFSPTIAPEDIDLEYFMRNPDDDKAESIALDAKARFVAKHHGRFFSRYDLDMMKMKPFDRAKLEVDILKFHTPQMQSVSADMNVRSVNQTLSDRLSRLARGEDISADIEE